MTESSGEEENDDKGDLIRAGEEVEQLEHGNRFVASTLSSELLENQGPSWAQNSTVAAGKNPVTDSPYWIRVQDGEQDTSYVVEVIRDANSYLECRIVKRISPEEDQDSDWLEHAREDRIVWTGSSQSRLESKHNDVMKEGDVRGSRNDLLGGHQ